MRITIVLDKKVFEALKTGAQSEIYLNITDSNVKLLCDVENEVFKQFKPITEIEIKSGLTNKAESLVFEVKGVFRDTFVNFIPVGKKKGDSAFTIEIGSLIV